MDERAVQVSKVRRRGTVAAASLVLAVGAATVLAGCSGSEVSGSSGGAASVATGAPKPAAGSGYDAAGGVDSGVSTSSGVGAAGQPATAPTPGADQSGSGGAKEPAMMPAGTGVLADRSIIRTASLTVRTTDVLATSEKAATLAQALGGFVAGEKTQASPDEPSKSEAVVVLRVPADRLPALLSQLRGLGTLLSEDQSADDVTGQVIDVAARIAAQKASVARIRALLARATTLGQVVQIEGELTSRQAALESLEGQAAALADQTTLATATMTVVGPKVVVAKHHTAPAPRGFTTGLSKGWHAFTTAGTWLLTAIGVLLPFLLLLTPFAIAGYVLARRRTRAVPAAAPAEPPPAAA
jgi:Domain of unknown function (DUF4349)